MLGGAAGDLSAAGRHVVRICCAGSCQHAAARRCRVIAQIRAIMGTGLRQGIGRTEIMILSPLPGLLPGPVRGPGNVAAVGKNMRLLEPVMAVLTEDVVMAFACFRRGIGAVIGMA